MQLLTFVAVATLSALIGTFVLDAGPSSIPRQKVSPVRSSNRGAAGLSSSNLERDFIQPVLNDEELAWCSRHSGKLATPKPYILRLPQPTTLESEKPFGRLPSISSKASIQCGDDCCNK